MIMIIECLGSAKCYTRLMAYSDQIRSKYGAIHVLRGWNQATLEVSLDAAFRVSIGHSRET